MNLSLTDSFVESLADLSPADNKRATAFLDKLLHAPDATGLRPEIVHDAGDRTVRSFKVTHDLRAIGRLDGASLTLLFLAQHDKAYRWARDHCIECDPLNGEISVARESAGHDISS